MDTQRKDYLHFFGESAFYLNEEEKEQAIEYLKYWKNNLLKKLNSDNHCPVLVEENYITRDPCYSGSLSLQWRISLKVAIRLQFNFEVNQYLGTIQL